MPEVTPPLPRLRFPEFRDNDAWEVKQLGALVNTITPPRKIQTSGYLPSGRFPIVDQSPNGICGWTDDETALVDADFPLVVFGDHSCVVKLAEGPFAQGADGIKILAPVADIEARFLYLSLQADPIEQHGYRRHFSTLKEKLIPFPAKETGEQQMIVDCFTSLDDLIRTEQETVAALRKHKLGLMQRLFPAPGETTPPLRFPEFCEAGPWEVKRLGDIATVAKGKGISKSDITDDGVLPCIRYGELYTHYAEVIREIVSFTNANPESLALSEQDDVIIPASGETKEDIAIASCVTLKGVALGGDLNIVRSPLYGIFLASYVRASLKSEIRKVAQGDSVVHLYPAQLEKLKLAVPPKQEEQQKIADCLTSLDDLIRGKEKVVEALEDHKRGLLQRLFPREMA